MIKLGKDVSYEVLSKMYLNKTNPLRTLIAMVTKRKIFEKTAGQILIIFGRNCLQVTLYIDC